MMAMNALSLGISRKKCLMPLLCLHVYKIGNIGLTLDRHINSRPGDTMRVLGSHEGG
jgi:hypothetical protein